MLFYCLRANFIFCFCYFSETRISFRISEQQQLLLNVSTNENNFKCLRFVWTKCARRVKRGRVYTVHMYVITKITSENRKFEIQTENVWNQSRIIKSNHSNQLTTENSNTTKTTTLTILLQQSVSQWATKRPTSPK